MPWRQKRVKKGKDRSAVFLRSMEEIQIGKYKHFKGNEYEVLYLARDSETMEEVVVYRALYGEGGVWVRPAKMWNEIVEKEGKQYKRFTFIE